MDYKRKRYIKQKNTTDELNWYIRMNTINNY